MLQKGKRLIMGLFIILFFSFFSQNALSVTTIGDTTFPTDVGKTYTWKLTYPPEAKGSKFTVKVESIDKGMHNSIDSLIVNCTFRNYIPTSGWVTIVDNSLYMAANKTQNYLRFEKYLYVVIIPTPINLTLVAQVLRGIEFALSYSIVDSTIILNYVLGESGEYTFNSNGFLISYIGKGNGVMSYKYVLDIGGEAIIPFENYFLVFTTLSVIALVYLKKQKIK